MREGNNDKKKTLWKIRKAKMCQVHTHADYKPLSAIIVHYSA